MVDLISAGCSAQVADAAVLLQDAPAYALPVLGKRTGAPTLSHQDEDSSSSAVRTISRLVPEAGNVWTVPSS